MKVLKITLLLLMLFSLTTAICYGQTAEDYLDKGTAYLNKGMYDEAIAEFKKAIEIRFDYGEAYYYLGEAYFKKRMYDEAIDEFEDALFWTPFWGPNLAEAHYYIGVAYFNKWMIDEIFWNLDDAIDEFKEAIEVNPEYAEAHSYLAGAYYEKEEYSLAFKHCDRAIELGYQFHSEFLKDLESHREMVAGDYLGMGWMYAHGGHFDEAIDEFKKAIEIWPSWALAHNDLGETYLNKGMYDEAIDEFKKAIEINPEYAEARYYLGVAYFDKGMYDEAIDEFKKVIEIYPNLAEADVNLGAAYLNKGMYDEAIAEFKKAIETDPEYAGAHKDLAVAYYEKGEYSLAIKHCDRAIELGYRVDPEIVEDLKPYRKVVIERIYTTPDKITDTAKMSFRPGDSICFRMELVFTEVEDGTPYLVEREVRDSNNELLADLSKKSEDEKKWDRTIYTGPGTIPKDAKAGTYTFIGKVKVGSFVAEKQAEFKVKTRED